jgi:hypothetical protein
MTLLDGSASMSALQLTNEIAAIEEIGWAADQLRQCGSIPSAASLRQGVTLRGRSPLP